MLVKEITDSKVIDITKLSAFLTGKQSRKAIAGTVQKFLEDVLQDDIEVSIETSSTVGSGEMSINAYYDPENDEDGDVAFEIMLVFNPTDRGIEWDDEGRQNFINELSDAVKHELLHAQQYRNRDYINGRRGYDKRNDEYEYMSRPDEIEAYAMNIADELVRKVDRDGAIELLRMAKKTAQFKDEMGRFLSPNLMAYFALFDWNAEHPVIKRLLKKIYQYISR